MPDSDETKVIRIASEIERYLTDHPDAADTLEGITNWWLARQRLQESVLLVRRALDYLVSKSVLESKTNLGGDQVFFNTERTTKDND